ncbi:MAG: heme o synthase, partial [Gammaproteobacteria bacterium]
MRFFSILKPGIIFGNIVTVTGGFFLGFQHHLNPWLLLITWLGMSLVIGSGCVINNFIDRDIDKLMERTKNRVLVLGLMSNQMALLYALGLGILGFAILLFGTNGLTTLVSFIGFFFYVVVYSLLLKRKSTWSTIVGSVAGAVPPVVGYCAVTNQFDIGAVLLFLILFFWQIPHFYAIAIYRLNDYKAASIP